MSEMFYLLNHKDDVKLKQAYLNSLPEPLRKEVLKISSTNKMALKRHYQRNILSLFD